MFTSSGVRQKIYNSEQGWPADNRWLDTANLRPLTKGEIAIVLPRETAEEFMDWRPGRESTKDGRWAGRFCIDRSVPYWLHFPSLAQHIGDVSSLANPNCNAAYRTSNSFVTDAHEIMQIS